MKKIGIFSVALLLSLATFSNNTAMNNNMSVPDLESSTTDFINEKSNIKKVSLRDAIRKSDSFKASKLYFQTASDSDGYEYLRFAAGLSGSYSKVSFTRNVAGLEDKTDEVTTLYKGITANGKVLYTNGDELLSENVESTKNYYWACYTIRFKSDSTYKDSDITLTLNVDDNKYTDSRTISLNDAKNYVDDKKIDITINEFKTYRMEAENLDFSQATLRDDFVTAGRTFIETPPAEYETSNGQSICGYKPGSIFEISLNLLEESTLYITSRMSDTELDYKINEGVKFEMDSTLMTAEDVTFTFHGHPNYWEWKEVVIGKITLQAGKHTFKMTALTQRPNIDYFDFEVLKYGDNSVVLDNVYNKNSKVATVVKEGLVTVEAEEMNIEHWKRASAFDANVQEMATASNGKYLAASSGSVGGNHAYYADFKIDMKFVGKVSFSAAYVQPEGKKTQEMDMTRLYAIYVDGVEVSLDSAKTTLAAREDATIWDVFNYNLVKLDKGEHTVRVELKENLSYAPNIDYIKCNVEEIKTVVSEAGSVKIEGEEMDLSNLVSDGNSLIEGKQHASTSGTGSLGHIKSGYIDIDFDVTFASTLTMKGFFSKYEDVSLKDYVEIKLDGVVVDFDDITLGKASDGSNDWFNWKEATVNFGDLEAGVHTLTINFKAGCNLDCVTLEFAAK